MRTSLYLLAGAATLCLTAGGSNALPLNTAGALKPAIDATDIVQSAAVYVVEGRHYCFYFQGWHGPGWYRCGFAHRRGFGWGGVYGWQGWEYGPAARRFGGVGVGVHEGRRSGATVREGTGMREGGRSGATIREGTGMREGGRSGATVREGTGMREGGRSGATENQGAKMRSGESVRGQTTGSGRAMERGAGGGGQVGGGGQTTVSPGGAAVRGGAGAGGKGEDEKR
jgi:hypothetical protein